MQEETHTPDLFHLTETEFFKNLRQGLLTEDLHIYLRDFIVKVHEVANPHSSHQAYALDAMLIADIEFKKFKSLDMLASANKAMVATVDMAHEFLLHKMEEVRKQIPTFKPTPKKKCVEGIDLRWRGTKTEFSELCYALKVGGFLGNGVSMNEIVRTLSDAFNADVSTDYAKSRIHMSKCRSENYSPTAFIEKMLTTVRKALRFDTCKDIISDL